MAKKIKKPFYKKLWVYVIPILIIIIGVLANKYNSKNNMISLNLSIIKGGNNKPWVIVKGNLPDETKGMINLINDKINYEASGQVVFKNGEAKVNKFTNKGNALSSGEYIVEFSTSIYDLQPESVKKVIGEEYSNIKSPYIVKDGLGTNIIYTEKILIK